MAKPVQTRASVSVGTSLPVSRVVEIAAKAAMAVNDDNARVRVEGQAQYSVSLSLRDHIDGAELMRFDVHVERAAGRTTARTVITSWKTKEGGVAALVPMARRKLIGFGAYEAYNDWMVSGIVAEDRQAIVTLVSGE